MYVQCLLTTSPSFLVMDHAGDILDNVLLLQFHHTQYKSFHVKANVSHLLYSSCKHPNYDTLLSL